MGSPATGPQQADSEIFNQFVTASSWQQEDDMRVSEEFFEWATCIALWGSTLLVIAFS